MSKIDDLKRRLASFDDTGECERSNYSAIAVEAIAHAEKLEALVRELVSELGSYHGGYPEFSDACKVCSLLARAKEVAGE